MMINSLEQIPDRFISNDIVINCVKYAQTIKHCGDYGYLFYNEKNNEFWLTLGDSDGIDDKHTSFEDIRKNFIKFGSLVDIEGEITPDDSCIYEDENYDHGYEYLGTYGIEISD